MKIIRRTNPVIEELSLATRETNKEQESQFWSTLIERITTTISKEQLELLFHIDGLTQRQVQEICDYIVSPGFYLETKDEALNKELMSFWDLVHGYEVMENIVKDIHVTGAGNGWLELGYTEKGDDIVTLRVINPKSGIDYLRNKDLEDLKEASFFLGSDYVALDEYAQPKGFKQDLGYYGPYFGQKTIWMKDKITVGDKEVWNPGEDKGLEPDGRDRIAHFKLYGLGESYLGMTPLETAYKQAIIRLNLEENVGESGHKGGGYIIKVKPLMEGSPVPKSQIDTFVNAFIKDLNVKSVFGIEDRVNIETMPIPKIEERENLMYYFADLQGAAMGRPIILDLQSTARRGFSGEAQQKAIDFELRMNALQKKLAEQIRWKIFYRYMKAKSMDYKNVPRIIFNSRQPVLRRERAREIGQYSGKDMIRYHPEVAKSLLQQLNLPSEHLNKEIKAWKKENKLSEPSKNKSLEDIIKETIEELKES